jgi:WD40 repeat protein
MANGSDREEQVSALVDAARRQARSRARDAKIAVGTDAAQVRLPRARDLPPAGSFPGYEITHEVHRGGQGIVYQATQTSTRRAVAIKVMREGPFVGPTDRARFEREVEILAQLKHPNIVAIHDSGHSAGLFFYVMDYIAGEPLDAYLARDKHSIRELLGLFVKICEAVNAAHLRGVTHRDLKPSNIRIDASGEPHVLDFGLAKLAAHEPTDASRPQVMTMTGQFIGSLPWASPEQAEGVPGKIDIRTDVYSLGVILYQMLTGRFPYDVLGPMRDVLDRIMNTDPARPSSIRQQINNEVETIVLKCLQKEPERRYQTAGELARDIQRYFRGEPIEAKRDSVGYLLRKQIRRHWAQLAAALTFVFLLIAALVITTSLYFDAEEARTAEAKARAEAEASEKRARDEAYIANIIAAQTALSTSKVELVRQRLDAIRPEFRNWEWCYLYAESDKSLATFEGDERGVNSVAISPDGARLALGGVDGTVRLCDATTGAELAVLRGHEGGVGAVAFSPAGTRLASGSGSADPTVRLWDTTTDAVTELAVLEGHDAGICCVAFRSDSARLASGSHDKTVRLWDVITCKQLAVLEGHSDSVYSLAFSPTGASLASGSRDATVLLWDTTTDAVTELAVLKGHDAAVCCVAFRSDSARLASGSHDKTVRLWDVMTYKQLAVLEGHSDAVYSLAFGPSGAPLASGSHDKTVRLWDVTTQEQLAILRGHEAPVISVVFSPDGARLVSGSDDGTVRLWDATADKLALLRGHEDTVNAVAFSPDGARLASGGHDRTIRLWDTTTGDELAVLSGHEDAVSSVAFGPNDTRLASGSNDGTGRLWDTMTGEPVAVLDEHDDRVHSVAFSPDGARLASASLDGTVRLWDATADPVAEMTVLRVHEEGISSVAFNANGTHLALGSRDGTVFLWDPSSGKPPAVLGGHEESISSVAFSPDGTRLASGSLDGALRLWDAATGNELANPSGHEDAVWSVNFSPDSTRLASGSADGTVRVWDVASGDQLMVLRGQEDAAAWSVAFSPDGDRLACVAGDAVRLYDAVPYEIRFRQRQDKLAARPEAKQRVDALFLELNDAKAVAQRLRGDRSLIEPLRQAALDLVLQRSAAEAQH